MKPFGFAVYIYLRHITLYKNWKRALSLIMNAVLLGTKTHKNDNNKIDIFVLRYIHIALVDSYNANYYIDIRASKFGTNAM